MGVNGLAYLPCYYAKVSPFIMYYELFTHKVNCLQKCEHMNAHWAIKIYVFVKFEIMREDILISCGGIYCCLQTFKLVKNVLVMGIVLGQSLMVISTTDNLLYANVSPLYNVLWECIVVVYR